MLQNVLWRSSKCSAVVAMQWYVTKKKSAIPVTAPEPLCSVMKRFLYPLYTKYGGVYCFQVCPSVTFSFPLGILEKTLMNFDQILCMH